MGTNISKIRNENMKLKIIHKLNKMRKKHSGKNKSLVIF
jgi:hypothetical protein